MSRTTPPAQRTAADRIHTPSDPEGLLEGGDEGELPIFTPPSPFEGFNSRPGSAVLPMPQAAPVHATGPTVAPPPLTTLIEMPPANFDPNAVPKAPVQGIAMPVPPVTPTGQYAVPTGIMVTAPPTEPAIPPVLVSPNRAQLTGGHRQEIHEVVRLLHEQPVYHVMLRERPDGKPESRDVSINDYTYTIPRGELCPVPRSIYLLLVQAGECQAQHPEDHQYSPRMHPKVKAALNGGTGMG